MIRSHTALIVAVMLLLFQHCGLVGQCSWSGVGGGTSGIVESFAVFDDGSGAGLYAGGFFTAVGGVAANGIAKWDGVSWSAVGSGVDHAVDAIVSYDDGLGPALFAAGRFSFAGSVPANRIAKWDGGSWSPLGSGTSGGGSNISTLCVYDDGTGPALYAGGIFTMAGGVPAAGIAKWDGLSWSALGGGLSGATGPFPGQVNATCVFDDGMGPALYVAGIFSVAGGSAANGIAKWDGVSWAPVGSGLSGVSALAVYDDGTGAALYAGGTLGTSFGRNVVRWNGSLWIPVGSGFDSGVSALAVFDDGAGPRLHASGVFTQVGGASANGIARWDGSSWSPLGLGLGWSFLGLPVLASVSALSVFDPGGGSALFTGGLISTAGGVAADGVARWGCGGAVSVTATQGFPGGAVHLANANLVPGHEYFNIVSLSPCPGGFGTGSFLGLCIDAAALAVFASQALRAPPAYVQVTGPPFRFRAAGPYVVWGPFQPFMPPATMDIVCIDVTGGTLIAVSPVARLTVQ